MRRELEALSLEDQFDVSAITDGFLAYTQARALQGQLDAPIETPRLWEVYRPDHGPPDGARIRGLHNIAIHLDNQIGEPAYTTIALGLINRVTPVFHAAQQWPEARALPEARDALDRFNRAPILKQARLIAARDRIAISPECPVCGAIG